MARSIAIADYTYDLPDDRIAQFPLSDRSASKLLCYKTGNIRDYHFRDVPDLLPADTTLVFNTTKVVCARILFPIAGKSKPVEIFILEPANNIPMEQAMSQKDAATWKCLVGQHKYFTAETISKPIEWQGQSGVVYAGKPVQDGDVFLVQFKWTPGITFSEMLDACGQIPLPPYMKRQVELSDAARYQTVYANEQGSVAAPTAGLHFTNDIIASLHHKHIGIVHVALHVGAGTFRPVKAATMEGHTMHAEEISVTRDMLLRCCDHSDTIVAVGTTSLRTLESLFWLGLKWKLFPDAGIPEVHQWDAYDIQVPEGFSYVDALRVLIDKMDAHQLTTLTTKTRLLIAPGYTIRSAKGLITNFHQPDSTLLLLVAAFIGEDWKRVYAHALEGGYRFLSYGDSSLLWRS